MKLVRLRIDRLPGIAGAFELDEIDPSLNLVVGPNASGKSSLGRALLLLYYAVREDRPISPISLEAVFQSASGRLTVTRQGSAIHWTRDGEPVEPPPLPDARFRSCFLLPVEELLGASDPADPIASRIKTDLAGGYDIDQLLAGPFKARAGASREKQALAAADRKLLRARNEHRAIRERGDQLAELEAQCEAAEAAAREVQACDRSLELLAARAQLERVEAELLEFPEGMALLSGQEQQQRTAVKERQQKLRSLIEEEQADERKASAELDGTALEGGQPTDAELNDHQAILELLVERDREREQQQQALEAARDSLDRIGAELKGGAPGGEPVLDPRTLSRVENELERKRAFDARLSALDSELMQLGEEPVDRVDLKRRRVARDELLRWLSNAGDAAWERRRQLLVLALLSCALAVTVVVALEIHSAFWAAALLELAAAAGLLRPSRQAARRRQSEERFLECGVSPPARFDRWSVEQRLDECDQEILEAERALLEHERRRQIENTREKLLRERRQVEEHLRAVAEQVGFDPGQLDAGLQRWLRLLLQYDVARLGFQEAEQKLERAGSECERLRSALCAFLSRYGEEPAPQAGVRGPRLALNRLSDRLALYRNSRLRQDGARRNCERLLAEREELDGELRELFRRAGLSPDDPEGLALRLNRLADWQELNVARREELRLVKEARDKLGDHPRLREWAERGAEAELREHRERFEATARELKQLERRITEIKKEIRDAKAGRSLEEARSEAAAAREALADRLDEDLVVAAGRLLIADVRTQHEQESRLPVLERAGEWFRAFTRNQFELRFTTGDGPAFRAYDTSAAELRPLEKLSSATRMQLLLSVRLAFLRETERGRETMPIFLDEALTTSDPARYQAVVEALAELARREDRQIFYLTAQDLDVQRFQALAGMRTHVIDLARLREAQHGAADPAELRLHADPVPSPEPGTSAEQYGVAVGAARIDPEAPASAMHVFHLLRDDLELLSRLLRLGIRTVGQLRSWLASDAAGSSLSESVQRALRGRVALALAWHAAYSEGRGKKVHRQALESGGVSEKFIDEVSEVCEALQGSAEALLDALDRKEVRGFHKKSRDRLEQHLEQEGFLDSRPVLTPLELTQRVLARLAPLLEDGTMTTDNALGQLRALDASILAPTLDRARDRSP